MKQFRNLINVVLIISAAALNSCSPIMQLTHNPVTEGNKYSSKGKISVLRFEDARPQKEIAGKGPKSRFKYQLPYKHTAPKFNEFIENSMETEIRESGIFNISDYAEYKLSGKITSFKCINKANGVTIAGLTFLSLFMLSDYIISASFNNGYVDDVNGTYNPPTGPSLPILIFGGTCGLSSLICLIAGKDKVTAIVSYDYVLKKNGKIITQNTINVVVNDKIRYKYNIEKSMEKSEIILDRALTQAIRQMLKEIDDKIK